MTDNSGKRIRNQFYEKVGNIGVEENKTIKAILDEYPIDKEKLSHFGLKYSFPSANRMFIWEVLVDMLPGYSADQEFLRDQFRQRYNDRVRTNLAMMNIFPDSPIPEKFWKIFVYYGLTDSEFLWGNRDELTGFNKNDFMALSISMNKMTDLEFQAFYLTKGFAYLLKKLRSNQSHLQDLFIHFLDEYEPEMKEHLQRLKFLDRLPLTEWFNRCFAETLHPQALVRIWDKIMSGSNKILIFVAISVLCYWFSQFKKTDIRSLEMSSSSPELETVDEKADCTSVGFEAVKNLDSDISKDEESISNVKIKDEDFAYSLDDDGRDYWADFLEYISKLKENTPDAIVHQTLNMWHTITSREGYSFKFLLKELGLIQEMPN